MKPKIGILIGSLRRESFSRKVANHLIKFFPENFDVEIIEIGQLPLFNEDFDNDNEAPETYAPFRRKIEALKGVVFVTPEYNRSMPAVLKNALDVASRPAGKNSWDKKPALIVSSSTGTIAGFGASHHLRQSLVFLNVYPLQQPEVYLAKIGNEFDEDGNLSQRTGGFLKKAVSAYIDWIHQLEK